MVNIDKNGCKLYSKCIHLLYNMHPFLYVYRFYLLLVLVVRFSFTVHDTHALKYRKLSCRY